MRPHALITKVEDLMLVSVSRKRAGPARSGEAGTITAIALLVLAILSVLGLSLLELSVRDAQVSTNFGQATQSLYAAEAGVESAYQQIKIKTSTGKLNPADWAQPVSAPVITFPSYTFSTFTVAPLFADCLTTPTAPECTQPITTGPYQGLRASTQNYLVTSEVTAPAPNQSRARIVQAVQSGLIGLFQFAIFYDQILEIFPGQPMTLVGRVHSNSHAYVGNGTQIDSYLTAAGNIYNYRYDNNGPCTVGTGLGSCSGPGGDLNAFAKIKNAAGTYIDLTQDSRSTSPAWASWALSTYNGLVRDVALQATPLKVPLDLAAGETPHQLIEKGLPGDSPTLQQLRLYWQADYRILVDSGGTVSVKTGPPGSETPTSLDPSSFLTTTTNFYDKREGACMQPAQINMGALRTAPGWNFTNGILYVSSAKADTGTCGTGTPNALRTPVIRLTNGAQLPPSTQSGFTVASDRPVYVQGNYNTTNKVSAAVMSDSITVLSQNWGPNSSDTKGNEGVDTRPATTTTINAALANGNVPTISGTRYSGGIENFIRLLENWSSVTLTYTGSLVDLWQSQTATGSWQSTGKYYNAPTRIWSFDTLFNTTLPPGTPRVQVTQKLGWWHQE